MFRITFLTGLKRPLFIRALFFLFFMDPRLHSKTLIVGYDQTPPFHYKDQTGRVIGTDADLIRAVVQRMGVSVKFVERPWIRILRELEKGDLDIAIGAKYTPERARFSHYSVSYKSIEHWLYCRDGEYENIFSIEHFCDDPRRTLGIVRGWGYPAEIARIINNENNLSSLVFVNDVKQLPRLLEAGRVEGIIITPAMLEEIERVDGKVYNIAKRVKYEEQLHFLLSKQTITPVFFNKFNNALTRLLKEGKLEEISGQYSK